MSTTELIVRLKQNFDDDAHTIEGVEVWFARDLQKLLGYEVATIPGRYRQG